ncbi:MAG: hypothetical protein AAF960_22260 [Bacteroidota bacterium]
MAKGKLPLDGAKSIQDLGLTPKDLIVSPDFKIPKHLLPFLRRVRLRIVGIYFDKTVLVPLFTISPLTVKDVLDTYVQTNFDLNVTGGLSYITETLPTGQISLRSFIYNYAGGSSLSGFNRPAGLYSLTETSLDDNRVGLGWQYYVIDGNTNINKSRTAINGEFTYFGEAPDYTIENGDTIIWRLVTIARKPNFPPRVSVNLAS